MTRVRIVLILSTRIIRVNTFMLSKDIKLDKMLAASLETFYT